MCEDQNAFVRIFLLVFFCYEVLRKRLKVCIELTSVCVESTLDVYRNDFRCVSKRLYDRTPLLLKLLPCTVLVFDSFTLYLYICNNNYLTTELVFFFNFTFLFNKCFRQSQRQGNFEAVHHLVLQITLASQF